MPVQSFILIPQTMGSECNASEAKIRRSLRSVSEVLYSGVASPVSGRIRTAKGAIALQVSGRSRLSSLHRLTPIRQDFSSQFKVQFFLDTKPLAPPTGSLTVPSTRELKNPHAMPVGLNGSRISRGTLRSVKFKIEGKRLNGLSGLFTACLESEPVGSPHDIEKQHPSSIYQTESVANTNNGLETMTGSFNLMPDDTASLASGEHRYVYRFVLLDGLGRVYEIETGRFSVYSHC